MVKLTGSRKDMAKQRVIVGELRIGGISGTNFPGERDDGTHWYVNSGTGASTNDGKSPNSPRATLASVLDDASIAANDTIWLMAGHAETVTAAAGLDVDTAGLTIYFLGNGANKASITFSTDVAADMDIDAANVTLVNPLFIAGIDALTGPIDVNAADFTIYDGEWRDAAAIAATDCIVADANADRMTIDGWRFIASTTGTQKQSNIQVAGANDVIIKNFLIEGDFGTGAIENGTAWVNATLENGFIDNQSASPTVGILLQATSTGQMANVKIRVASGTTYLTANNDMQFFNCWGVGVDADRGQEIGAAGPFDAAAAPATGVSNRAAIRAIYNAVAADGTASSTAVMPGLGRRVTKSATLASDPDDLFTVTGLCLITLMVGEVTSVFATTTSMSINSSTNSTVIAISTDVVTDVVGTLYMVTGDPDEGLNGATGGVAGADVAFSKSGHIAPFLMNDDRIYMNLDGAGTGLIDWTLYYIPLEDSAAVTSSA